MKILSWSAREDSPMKKILLIDDEPMFRVMMQRELENKGWKVLEAADGEIGIKIALQERPDVVVCDLLMPRTNGFQVCRTLRAKVDLFPKTKIIVTTSSGYDSDRINALQAGADEYLLKPLKPGQLLKILEAFKVDGEAGPTGPSATVSAEEEVRLRFWGVRGSIPTPGPSTVYFGGNTSCVEVRAHGQLMILDAGTGIRSLGLSLAEEFKDQPIELTLLITHTHWDHIQGFPFFPVAYNPKNTIRVLAFEGARKSLEATLSSQMESPYFPISMQQMPGNITIEELKDKQFAVGPVKVEAMFTNHPGICACYKLITRAGAIVYIPDNELLQRLRASKAETTAEKREATEFARARDEKLRDFIRGAEVVMMDCQYDCDEYPRYVGWGHSCVDDSVTLAVEAGVKQFFLFHHDPSHNDKKIATMVEEARELAARLGGKFPIDAAREGLEIVLKAPKKK
jgi:phosphoribosyl 1,2-cyclic phosphodiesterase/ActR/RegA family two-component response regulator